MFPLEGNGVRPHRQDSFESWHQVLPQPLRPTQNPDRYKWNDINALFEDPVQIVSFSHLNRTKAGTSKPKGKKVRPLGNIKIKRLVKTKAGGKRFYRSVADLVSIKGRRCRLKLGKRGTPATCLLRNTKKKFKKAIGSAAESHK